MDRHYTPSSLATKAIELVGDLNPTLAADFAAGEGALLRAIHARWPKCELIANDIDADALGRLSTALPIAKRACSDFTSARSRGASPLLRRVKAEGATLIALNPPFSNRGGHRVAVCFEGAVVVCGAAISFLLGALPYLAENGRMIALLPTSALTSERDSAALALIKQRYVVEEILPRTKTAFRSCSVEVACVLLTHRKSTCIAVTRAPNSQKRLVPSFPIAIFRGKVSVHRPDNEAGVTAKFVHTTGLYSQGIRWDQPRTVSPTSVATGPCVLLPRIGSPAPHKVHAVTSSAAFVPSDCIFVLQVKTPSQATTLVSLIRDSWDGLAANYVGSCARYLTIARLQAYLDATVTPRPGMNSSASRGSVSSRSAPGRMLPTQILLRTEFEGKTAT